MVTVIDYGVGNLFSLTSSLAAIGEEVTVSGDPAVIRAAERLILPGVGAFADARAKLAQNGLDAVIIDCAKRKVPIMGICLGMQMLFETSYEYGKHEGLGLIPGSVVSMEGVIPNGLKIPHIGWNALHFHRAHPLFAGVKEGDFVYFVHSYYATHCEADTLASTDYGAPLTAAVARGNVMGCQFHPEKSGEVGLNILRAFCKMEVEA